MSASKNNFIDHVKWFRRAVGEAGAEAIVSMDSWQAFVRDGARQLVFYPQFQATISGQMQYQQVLTDDATMFAGWLPYRLKRWETAVDKLAFKRYAQSVGLRVPPYWLTVDTAAENVVVKSPKGSFGTQVIGPYREGAQRPLDLTQGEYYERFIEGRLLKVWFWEDKAVCAELDSMPAVWGDGVSTLAQLILRRASQFRPPGEAERERLLQRCGVLLGYYNRKLTDVLPKSERQVIEFRYGSTLMHSSERQILAFDIQRELPWLVQVQDAGQKMFAAIPGPIRSATMFTLDAILAPGGDVYLLEVNCNPTVHPLVYPIMAKRLLGLDAAANAATAAVH